MAKKYTPCLTDYCYFTGATNQLECHHIFGGAYRKQSEKYGMKVMLHYTKHNVPGGVHFDHDMQMELKRFGQLKFIELYPDIDFHSVFGNKSYL